MMGDLIFAGLLCLVAMVASVFLSQGKWRCPKKRMEEPTESQWEQKLWTLSRRGADRLVRENLVERENREQAARALFSVLWEIREGKG